MKKFILVLTVLILSLGFFGCDNGTNGNGVGPTFPVELRGTWEHTISGFTITINETTLIDEFSGRSWTLDKFNGIRFEVWDPNTHEGLFFDIELIAGQLEITSINSSLYDYWNGTYDKVP